MLVILFQVCVFLMLIAIGMICYGVARLIYVIGFKY